jgi:hypothetical protein
MTILLNGTLPMTRFLILRSGLTGLFLALAAQIHAAVPPVSNREPVEDDIGYLPRAGATVKTNPPALAWLPEKGAAGYAVQMARDAAFTREVIEIRRTPYSLYTHTEVLAPGAWWWRYACVDATGSRSAWSQVREFTVAADAQPFPRPTEELVRARLPAAHPRLMLRPEEVAIFRAAAQGREKERWQQLAGQAEELLKLALIPEPPPYSDGKWNAPEWRRSTADSIRAASAAETLAFCYLISGDPRFGEGAKKWLRHLATWQPLGSTSMKVNDEAGMPILYLTSRAYDWAYSYLGEADRTAIRQMVRARGEEAYQRMRGVEHEQKAYHSHAGRMWHFLGEAAIACHGELPEAKEWLEYALTIFWGWYPAFGDEDGGWAQGYAYWSSYVNRSTWWHDALLAGLQIDGTEKPFYRNVAMFPMYVAPPGGAVTGFGDFAEARPNAAAAAVVAYFARRRQRPEWQWYGEAWGRPDGSEDPIDFLRTARPARPAVAARAPADWPTARLFRGAGWAALHTNLIDGRDDVQVMLRAAPLGNGSHSHADQNAIVVGAFGSPLLVNTGVRPWFGSPFCKEWYWTTKAHNALEIDGEGQPKTWKAKGEFVAFNPGDRFDHVVGDATAAYGHRVSRYRRHLVFLKPDVVVMLDEVKAPQPVALKFWLHGRAPFAIDRGTGGISLEFERAALNGFVLAPGGLAIDQTDKYSIPPESGSPEPEWHLSAETRAKSAVARIVAVLGISRAGAKVELGEVTESVTGDIVSVEFRRAGERVQVAFDTARASVRVR